jgi:hypothetical protein
MRGFKVHDPMNIQRPTPLILLPVGTRISCTWPQCNVTFARESDRRRPISSIHRFAGRTARNCPFCGKGCSRTDYLTAHIRGYFKHTAYRRFSQWEHLRAHMRSHFNLRAYRIPVHPTLFTCPIHTCAKSRGKGYSRKDKLAEQM